MNVQEIVDLQCMWLDTSQAAHATRATILRPLVMTLDHIKTCRLSRELAMASLCGQLLKLWESTAAPVAVGDHAGAAAHIQAYIEALYRHFDEEWSGSLAYLTHRREGLEDAVYFLLLERRGTQHGGYRPGAGKKAQNGTPMKSKVVDLPLDLIDQMQAEATDRSVSFAQVVRERLAKSYEI